MGVDSNISWTDATWNPFRGCTKISPGCQACYAETLSKRNPGTLGTWGPGGVRVVGSDANWGLPFKWNKEAKAAGIRRKVFSLSLGDWLEDYSGAVHDTQGNRVYRHVDANASAMDGSIGSTLDDCRVRMLDVIRKTPDLDYLLLTKRPQNWRKAIVAARGLIAAGYKERDQFRAWLDAWLDGEPPHNVWIGVSVEDQQRADERLPVACRIPAVVRFVSYEPMLGPVDWTAIQTDSRWPGKADYSKLDALRGFTYSKRERFVLNGIVEENGETDFADIENYGGIHWLILGGESGPKRRPMRVEWIRDSVDQCRKAGVAAFVKQDHGSKPGMQGRIPDPLWAVKEFPKVGAEDTYPLFGDQS